MLELCTRVEQRLRKQHRAVAVGLKVDAHIIVHCRVVQVLHARGCAANLHAQALQIVRRGPIRIGRLHDAHLCGAIVQHCCQSLTNNTHAYRKAPCRWGKLPKQLLHQDGSQRGDAVPVKQQQPVGMGRKVQQAIRITIHARTPAEECRRAVETNDNASYRAPTPTPSKPWGSALSFCT